MHLRTFYLPAVALATVVAGTFVQMAAASSQGSAQVEQLNQQAAVSEIQTKRELRDLEKDRRRTLARARVLAGQRGGLDTSMALIEGYSGEYDTARMRLENDLRINQAGIASRKDAVRAETNTRMIGAGIRGIGSAAQIGMLAQE